MFPPLCFIDAGSGDAAAKGTDTASAAAASAGKNVKNVKAAAGDTPAAQSVSAAGDTAAVDQQTPEVRFFFLDLLQKLWSWISGLWS
ncbi:hypothetical protein D3C73_1562750 [compost metagenome]